MKFPKGRPPAASRLRHRPRHAPTPEIPDVAYHLARFKTRVLVAGATVLCAFGLLAARLVHLQVTRHDDLAAQAEGNRTAVVPVVPERGLILDRNGVVLASNYSAYTLEITPAKAGDVEQTIDRLADVVEITPRDRRRFKRLREDARNFESLPIRSRLTDEEVARFAAQHYRFPGVEINARLFRRYPLGETGSHVLGYIGRINQREKSAMEDWDEDEQANYRGTDHIGKLGIEQSYEKQLHGQTGVDVLETAASGRAVRELSNHRATSGRTVMLTLDIALQKLVEDLFGERRGALVAIDPRSGEVLAMVSKPTFDPNAFVEGIDLDSWQELSESIDKPLLNRALRGTYPPGSTYKPFMALAALQQGVRGPRDVVNDPGYFNYGGRRFGSPEGNLGGVDMRRAIQLSSNTYFFSLAVDMGVDAIHDFMAPLGFGQVTGVDLPGEVRGVLPSTDWKRQAYKRADQGRWFPGETVSLGIGQGYNNFTMLQLAVAEATLASGGIKHRPHLVRALQDPASGRVEPLPQPPGKDLHFAPRNVGVVRDGLVAVIKEGTGKQVFAGAAYSAAGKTGTAQAVTLRQGARYNARVMEEHQRDHSLFAAFAPVQDPQIALAVIVENAGWGAAAAAPIARRVFDYWLDPHREGQAAEH
ncbi:penicillin-binding protein 2 [Pseudorhodoferax sp. Leaf274]|uniref:penicillin-binding protein 2 n=1 Tax=Pseudorhodoferax sp. Leaf274 TaxID=1736318 RepID=UPI0009EAEA38|nr:penicillin-binding protein 2 [Pseudorhodoferax sp. Leaf274]